MSTQTRFDIAGLSRAIEQGDPRYQTALYADDAEIVIVDSSNLTDSPQILHGKPAIRDWLEQVCWASSYRRVLDPQATEAQVSLTEECEQPDGTSYRYSRIAEVSRGQIVRETVTRTRSTHTRAPQSVSRQRPMASPPAGNFLG